MANSVKDGAFIEIGKESPMSQLEIYQTVIQNQKKVNINI